ncbi:Uu.00g103330.m01.CDS01 [Anthostomella pinea]|uniref:Uu.00g103330.m01.CDS01 n=1 Tax=Anthostomella pinea TaxID=933095 RepID=A0AAI8YFQ6_9PEZI|nr:Uu.00g103330.m01.CDS01 [Anthostomella pinea]
MASEPPEALKNIKALTFDVFGTVVDWRSTVHDELVSRAQSKLDSDSPHSNTLPSTLQSRLRGLTDDDWAQFAQEWRDSYMHFTRSFVPGETAWKDIDTHHHDSLQVLLQKSYLNGLYSPAEVRELSLIWHRLRPWDDAAAGIRALGTRGLVTATLSNGNQALLRDLNAQGGGLGFKKIVSTADFGAYKPHPSTYLGAAAALECRPDEVAMVAAHLGDLQAARSCGLRTIYVERPREEAWAQDAARYREARGWVDIWVGQGEGGFQEVARRLGISPDE